MIVAKGPSTNTELHLFIEWPSWSKSKPYFCLDVSLALNNEAAIELRNKLNELYPEPSQVT